MKTILGIFSQAFVINMNGCHKRMELMAGRLKNLGIEFERFPALRYEGRGPKVAARGCGMSHLEVVCEAQRRGLESVLIMEDDAIFRPDFLKHWSTLQPQFEGLQYDIFYGYDWYSKWTSNRNLRIKPIVGTLCCHFWAIHCCFYDAFISKVTLSYEENPFAAIDRLFTKGTARMYAPTYNLVGQDQGRSFIENNWKSVRWSA
jgi:GR25 family glycosyltransferase involved in LPS biosynthesis